MAVAAQSTTETSVTGAPTTSARPASRAPSDRSVTALFVVTSFLGSALLFGAEPMVARMLLPRLGGSPAVWTTALVFFQAALLLGYWLAHALSRRLPVRRHVLVQLLLLMAAGATLPVRVPGDWIPPLDASPVGWTLLALVVAVGAPFVVLSTASPTLQRWLADTDHPSSRDPYFLYAAGNAGSFLALLAYPFLIEPALGLRAQSRVWAGAYAVLVACTAACALVARARGAEQGQASQVLDGVKRSYSVSDAVRWVGLAAVPSALLVGVSRHISTDIAAIPLLWIIPLSIYLLSFVLVFGGRSEKVGAVGETATLLLIVPVLWTFFVGLEGELWKVSLHLLGFAAVACAAHGRLAVLRPPVRDLSSYYLALSLGGVLGGIAAAIAAPLLFETVLEYPAALVAGLLGLRASRSLLPQRSVILKGSLLLVVLGASLAVDGTFQVLGRVFFIGSVASAVMRRAPRVTAAVLLAAIVWQMQFRDTGLLAVERSFFAVSRVEKDGDHHVLVSGTTIHGMQRFDSDSREPLTYYVRRGPIGQTYDALAREGPLDVGVVGLGAGTLASYGRPGDRFTFYEIDASVIRIARDDRLFSYLNGVNVDVRVGDGRLVLEHATSTRHDLLVLDAFSSDSIPVHLLTREAFEVYTSRLARGGVLAVHVSNRFFDLVPQVAALGQDVGLQARVNRFPGGDVTPGHEATPRSIWVVLSADDGRLEAISARGDWQEQEPAGNVWTDDHSNLLATLK